MHMRHQVVVHCCIALFTASRYEELLIYLLTKIAAAALLCPGVSPLLWLLPSALRSTFSPSLSSSGPVARPPFTTAVSMACHASHVVMCCLTNPLSVTDMACFSCVLVVFCVTAESTLHFYNLSNDSLPRISPLPSALFIIGSIYYENLTLILRHLNLLISISPFPKRDRAHFYFFLIGSHSRYTRSSLL